MGLQKSSKKCFLFLYPSSPPTLRLTPLPVMGKHVLSSQNRNVLAQIEEAPRANIFLAWTAPCLCRERFACALSDFGEEAKYDPREKGTAPEHQL